MNIYYIFAPVGIILVALFSFCRVYSWSNWRRIRLLGSRLDKLVATLLSIVLCFLIYAESWHGLMEFFMARATDALSEFVGLCAAAFAPIVTAIAYGWLLSQVANCASKVAQRALHLLSSSTAYDRGAETLKRFWVYDGKGSEPREYVVLKLGGEVKVLPTGNDMLSPGKDLPGCSRKAR